MRLVNRPAWSPDNASPEQLDLVKAARKAMTAAAKAEADAWVAVAAVRAAEVPDVWLERLIPGLSRATMNRKLGARGDTGDTNGT